MTDEEKKAIKGLEWSQQQMRLGNLPDYNQSHYKDIRIILNLIEKQSKEIEELEKNRKVSQNFAKIVATDYISKDKIKAKIEEYKKERYIAGEHLVVEVLESLLKGGE